MVFSDRCCFPEELSNGPECNPLAVGEAATLQDTDTEGEASAELIDQAGLADACRPQHCEQVAPTVGARRLKSLHQHLELSFPSDHGRPEAALDLWCVRTHRDETEGVDRG